MGAQFSSAGSAIASGASAAGSAVGQRASWFGAPSLLSLIGSALLFVVGGLILGDVIPVDQSAKSGGVAGLFIGASLLLVLGATSRGAVPTPGEEGLGSRFFRAFPPITGSLTNGFRIMYYFLPYALFIAGALIDITTTRLQFFPAGLTGFVAVLLNYLISMFYTGPVTDRDMCGIPGLSAVGSSVAPQSMVFNLSTLSHIAMYISLKQGIFGVNKIWPAWVAYVAVAVLNSFVLYGTGCFNDNVDALKKIGFGLVFGTLAGLLGGWVSSKLLVPSGSSGQPLLGPGGTQTCPDGSTPGPNGECPTSSSQTCSAVGDDQFVCEAYKNGQLVTSTIVE
jgi:hypothetical protein